MTGSIRRSASGEHDAHDEEKDEMSLETDPPSPDLETLLRELRAALDLGDHAAAEALARRIERRLLDDWARLAACESEAAALRAELEARRRSAPAATSRSTEPPSAATPPVRTDGVAVIPESDTVADRSNAAVEGTDGAARVGANADFEDFGFDSELSFAIRMATTPRDPPAPATIVYPVWYATTRAPAAPGDDPGYGGERGQGTHYGTVDVVIPAATRYGESGSGWLRRLVRLDLRDDTIRVEHVTEQPRDAFFADLKAGFATVAGAPPEALVFIHGFRTSFEDAAIRAAQIGRDLGLPPPCTGFFSWPSDGTLPAYTSDEAAIEASEGALARFLVDVVRESGAAKVHLVAHSMGNRGLLRALQRIASRPDDRVRFGQIFLAAPDVDRDLFVDLAHLYADSSERTTLYASNRDLAVYASRRLHRAPRVGLFDPVTRAAGVDTVCVPDFDLDLLGHGYFAQAEALLSDMGTLLRTNQAPPRQRIDEVADPEQVYWQFRR